MKKIDPVLQLRPAFKGQVVTSMKIECIPELIVSTVTTGVVQTVYTVNVGNISNFATRFASLYEEYRIVKAKFYTRLFSSNISGLLLTWVDEKTFGVPTLAESRTKTNKRDMFNASCIDRKPLLSWTPHDPLDQQYTSTSVTNTFAAFKVYSDNANYAMPIVATAIGEIFAEFTVQFRGLI